MWINFHAGQSIPQCHPKQPRDIDPHGREKGGRGKTSIPVSFYFPFILSHLFFSGMSHYLMLLKLRDISARSSVISKAKKYLKPGQKPPAGVQIHTGPRKGIYYNTEDLKGVKESKKKEAPKKEEESGEKKKRLPAFRKQEDGSVMHRTKEGEHGPGAYRIESKDGEHHLTFEGKDGDVKFLGKHTDIKELKRMVSRFKEGKNNELDTLLADAQRRYNETSDWWKQKYPNDIKSVMSNAEKARMKELLGGSPEISEPIKETPKPDAKPVSPVKISSDKISYEKELPDGYGKIVSRMVSTTGEDLFTEIVTPSGKSFFKPNPSTIWMNVWVQPNGKKMSVWEGVTPEIAQGRITDAITAMKKLEKKGSSSVEEYYSTRFNGTNCSGEQNHSGIPGYSWNKTSCRYFISTYGKLSGRGVYL